MEHEAYIWICVYLTSVCCPFPLFASPVTLLAPLASPSTASLCPLIYRMRLESWRSRSSRPRSQSFLHMVSNVHRDCSYVSVALQYVILREFVRFRTGRPCRFHVLAIFQQYFVFRTKLCLPPLCTHQQLCKQIDLLLAIFVKIWSLCELFGADGIN